MFLETCLRIYAPEATAFSTKIQLICEFLHLKTFIKGTSLLTKIIIKTDFLLILLCSYELFCSS